MVAVTALPSPPRPLTRADLDAMPDDGYRRELVDGVLIVSASPRPQHQRVLRGLFRQLDDACPAGLDVLWGPLHVALGDDTVLVPDLLVAAVDDFSERDLPTAPLLAVEVLSPSTRHFDLGTKLRRYEAAGTPSYWVVDPGPADDETGPGLTAWELRGGAYVEVARVSGEEVWHALRPFPVRLTPARMTS